MSTPSPAAASNVLWLAAFGPCLVAAGGCAGGVRETEAARAALVASTFVDADRALIATRPELVAGKYEKMRSTLQAFLRGTPPLWYRDHTTLRGDEAVLHGEGAELVQLLGDPHLENLGSSFDDEGMLLECSDFDATVRGPFAWDLERAALGVAVLMATAGLPDEEIDPPAAALASGWWAAVAAQGDDPPPGPIRSGGGGGRIVGDVLRKAAEKLAARSELAESTEQLAGGARTIARDGVDLADVSAPFDDGLAAAVARYRRTRKGGRGDDGYFQIKDVARRFNAGVASFANLRFLVLVEGETGADDDDILIELKEQRDPPLPVALLGRGPDRPNNAVRVVEGSRLLQASSTEDVDLGWVDWHGVAFQVRRETAGRRNLKVADIAAGIVDGRYEPADVVELARAAGTLLGAAHARGGDRAALLRVAGDETRLGVELATSAARDLARLRADLHLFAELLDERGPLLGAR